MGSVSLAISSLVVGSPALTPPAAAAVVVEPPLGGLVESVPDFGATQANLSVSDDGAAQYAVPIWLPEGRGNVRPALTLGYNSRAGNGTLGVGWSLAGLPSVRPCPRTLAQDGAPDTIHYDGTDVYCLDGQRLVPVGEHTGTEQEYRTEQDSFTRVVSYGPAGAVPAFFRGWSKDGRILTFGETEQAQMRAYRLVAGPDAQDPSLVRESDQPVVAAWGAERIEDRNGNVASIEYFTALGNESDLWSATMWAEEITYEPNRTISLDWGLRTDQEDVFSGGVHTQMTRRLNAITVSAGPAGGDQEVLRTYTMDYGRSSVTGRNLLERVTECDRDGVCLRPVEFSWSGGSTEFDAVETPVTGVGTRLLAADVDGDGRDDLLHLDTCAEVLPNPPTECDRNLWSIRRSVGTGPDTFGPHELTGLPRARDDGDYRSDVRPIDFDRDARVDVMAEVDPDGGLEESEYKLWRSNGTVYEEYEPDLTPLHNSVEGVDLPYFADLDGNGTSDFVMPFFVQPTDQRYHYRLNTGDGFGELIDTGLVSSKGPSARTHAVDHDGDGRAGLVIPEAFGDPNQYLLFGLDADGEPTLEPPSVTNLNIPYPASADPRDQQFADVNGDGLTDAVHTRDLQVQLNSGRGFSHLIEGPDEYFLPPSPTDMDQGLRIADFTNDGADDVMVLLGGEPEGPNDTEHGIQLFTWRDDGFVRVPVDEPAGHKDDDAGWSATQPLDVDGDDVLDMVRTRLVDDPDDPGSLTAQVEVLQRAGGRPDLLLGATVAAGPRSEVSYSTLADRDVHEPGTCAYPLNCAVRGGIVVAEHSIATHAGAGEPEWDTYRHSYEAARTDAQGRGWLGFAEHTVTRDLTGETVVTTFDNVTWDEQSRSYPFAGRPKTRVTMVVDPATETSFRTTTDSRWDVEHRTPGVHTVQLGRQTVTEQEAVRREAFRTIRNGVTTTTYDAFGNADLVVASTDGGRTSTTDPTFEIDVGAWLISQPDEELRTGCTPDGECDVRETDFVYDGSGNLTDTIVEPDSPGLTLTTTTDYGQFGVVDSVTVTDGEQARTETFDYDDDWLHPTGVTNAEGHRSEVEIHSGLGVRFSETGPNGVEKTTMLYDGFGRLRETNRSDGSFERIGHEYRAGSSTEAVTTDTSGGGRTVVVTDPLGREIQSEATTFDGLAAVTDTDYDALGRVTSVSRPHLADGTQHRTFFTYDVQDRQTLVTAPDGQVRHEYSGLRVDTFDALGVQSFVEKTVEGEVELSYEDDPESDEWLQTSFEYGPFGEMTLATAPDGTSQSMDYDLLGRRTELVDPSAGTTTSTYNAFGELDTETNGAGQTSEFVYDRLGRIETVTTPHGVTTNEWDTAERGVGQLATSTSEDGVVVEHGYDDLARPETTTWTVDGIQYQVDTSYDEIGRQASLTYPAVPDAPEGTGRLTVEYAYNDHGYLAQVRDAANPNPDGAFWTAEERNAAGQLTLERYGNGVVTEYEYRDPTGLLDSIEATGPGTVGVLAAFDYDYDPNRNVTLRLDSVNQREEQYGYDELRRLERWAAGVPGAANRTIDTDYNYDSVGNLEREVISRPAEGLPAEEILYEYGENGAPPHALTSRNAQPYGYDGAGRQVSGTRRGVEYNVIDLPRAIDWGQGQRTEFAYDAGGARVLKRDGRHTLVSIPGLFERRTPAGTGGTEIHNIHHIVVEGRTIAQVNRIQPNTGGAVSSTRVWHLSQDHQGSTILVTRPRGLEAGHPGGWIQDLHYDPFGRRLDPDYTPQGPNSHGSMARFGFTGHEHDDEFGLINMKGRIYDPAARRFLSPDPAAGDPLRSQSYNRYAYALNNPATLVDPSGFEACGLAVSFICPPMPTTQEVGSTLDSYLDAMAGYGDQTLQLQMIHDEGGVPTGDDGGDVDHLIAEGEAILVTPVDLISHNGNHFYRGDNGEYIGWLASEGAPREYATFEVWNSAIENSKEVGRFTDEQWESAFGGVDALGGTLEFGVMLWAAVSPGGQRAADAVDLIDTIFDDGPVDPLSVTPPLVGPHGRMPRPRPAGTVAHHGVNTVWAKANVPGYNANKAPSVEMGTTNHHATFDVFNKWRSEIAARQGVKVKNIDWTAVSPGSAWRLAEEQFAAAGTAAATVENYFLQWNHYLASLQGGL